jgi:type IV pilus biogenesis protein PilP
MSNSTKHIVFLAALLSSGAVLADITSDKLTQIEAETLLLKAREKQLDVQASIVTKQNEIAAKQNTRNLLTQSATAGDPVVHGVEGLGRAVFATLQLSDGSIIDVQAGDVLSNGMQIVSIAPSSVIVQQGKKRIRLAPYTPRQAAFIPNLPIPGLIPPLPAAAPKGAVR